jgi:hypothetical protein
MPILAAEDRRSGWLSVFVRTMSGVWRRSSAGESKIDLFIIIAVIESAARQSILCAAGEKMDCRFAASQ